MEVRTSIQVVHLLQIAALLQSSGWWGRLIAYVQLPDLP